MQQAPGTDLFYFAAKIPNDTRAAYVFVADYATTPDPNNPRQTKSSLFVEDFEVIFAVDGELLTMSWFDMPGRRGSSDPTPQAKMAGKLTPLKLTSQRMKGETIPVTAYTPPGYRTTGEPYPVVFVHGGMSARESGALPQLVDEMIRAGKIREVVLVFIDRPFDPLRGAPGYEAMFGAELMPMIDKEFHVSRDRADRGATGGGFGALLALTAGMSNRDQIGRLALHSVFYFELMQPMIDFALATQGPKASLLVQWGTYDLANPDENWNMGVMNQRLVSLLEASGHAATARTSNDGSDWICWRSHAQDAFNYLLEKTK